MWETWVQSLSWEHPLERERLPTPIFWPGEFHGLYSPWGHKELGTTEQLALHCKYIFALILGALVISILRVTPWKICTLK